MDVLQPIEQVPMRLASLLEHSLDPRQVELHKRLTCGPFCRVKLLEVCH